jgi:hypothetical protein
LGINLDAVRDQVQEIIGQGQQAPSGHIPFTPRAKKVLELSLREAHQLSGTFFLRQCIKQVPPSDCIGRCNFKYPATKANG